jgi:DTW domain-containing protein
MFERKRKTKNPCVRCGLHAERCICAQIPKLALKTRVLLVVHAKELKRTTNTGRLAIEALSNSALRVRGEGRLALDLSPDLAPEYESVILYPSEDAVELSSLKSEKPVQLIVPDGNWRQAGKVRGRHPELKGLKAVKVSESLEGRETLRKEHFEGGKSTLEAIAQALSVLEGEEAVRPLMDLYRAKLAATLAGRPAVSATHTSG